MDHFTHTLEILGYPSIPLGTGSKICVTREDLAHSVSIVSDRWRTRDV